MKLFYCFIALGLLQFLDLTSAQVTANSNKTILAQKKLIDFYENGMTLLSKDFCQKAQKLSEQVLRDNKIQKAESLLIKEFKQHLTSFLHNYEFFERYGLYNKMLTIFSEMTIGFYYTDGKTKEILQDSQYILRVLKAKGYDTICDEYEQKFQEFIKEKFLAKFAEFQKQLSPQDLKNHQNLIEWFKELKQCQDYRCYYKYFNLLINFIHTPKQQLLELINGNLERITLFYILGLKEVAQQLQKDQISSKLSPSLKTALLKDLNDFLDKFSSNVKFERTHDLILMFHSNIAVKYYYNVSLASEDHEILKNIFDQHGFAKLQAGNQKLFNDFMENGLTKLFKQFKLSLTKEELRKEQDLLKWFEEVEKLHNYEERVKAFNKFYALIMANKN